MTLPSDRTPSMLGGRGVLRIRVSHGNRVTRTATLTALEADQALELEVEVEVMPVMALRR